MAWVETRSDPAAQETNFNHESPGIALIFLSV
jgi:hypothetical protein